MDDSNKNPVNQPPSNDNHSEIRGRKVLQPTSAILQEMPPPPPASPAVALPAPPTVPIQPRATADQIYPTVTDSHGPNSPGASQIEGSSMGRRGEGGVFKKILLVVILLALVIGGFFISDYLSGTGSKILTNGSYTYTFTFNKTAKPIHLSNGSSAYKYSNNVIAGVQPATVGPLTSCSQIGSRWAQAFSVQVYGSSRPVCTLNNEIYIMYFSALNTEHSFTVVYNSAQTSAVYPTLETMFGSVKVSQ